MISKNKENIIFRVVLLTLAGSFIYAMYSGIRNNFGIMLNSIVDNSGLSFASVSFILAVGQLVFGLVQPAFGIIVAKKGTLYAFISGIALAIMGMLLTPLCKSILPLMLCLGVILPAGCGAVSYGIIMGTVTPKLPEKSVSAVSGIINASSGIGNIVLSPLINSLLNTGGLMYGMLVLTVPVFLTFPASLLMGKKGKTPSADIESASEPKSAQSQMRVKEWFQKAIKDGNYRCLMIGFFTCGFHMALVTNHLPTQIQSFGFSSEASAYAFSIYGIITIVGSVLSGSLCGKLKMKNVLTFYYGLRPITILLFLIVPKTLLTITVFTALFGFSGAATVPPVSGIISKTYGAHSLAMLYGLVFFIHQTGGFFGAWLGGICFSVTGSYTIIWCVSLVFSLVAAIVSFVIKESRDAAIPMYMSKNQV